MYCQRHDSISTSGIIDHAVPRCECGLSVYVVVLSRDPVLFAYVDVTPEQRHYILDNGLNVLQALWHLQLPVPVALPN